MWLTGVLLLLRLAGVVSCAHPWHARETNATSTRASFPWFAAHERQHCLPLSPPWLPAIPA